MKTDLLKTSGFELFERELSQREKRKLEMVKAAIDVFATKGFDGVTFETIAKRCKVTRTLVNHYFESLDEVFSLATRFVRVAYQQRTIEKLSAQAEPEKLLPAYIHAALDWYDEEPTHFKLWMLYYHRAATDSEFAAEHTEFVDLGTSRIQSMLVDLKSMKKTPPEDLRLLARSIQMMITGFLITVASEERAAKEKRQLKAAAYTFCCRAAGLPVSGPRVHA